MSYDGWVQMDDPDSGDAVTLAEIGNYTSNVSPMWRRAMAVATGEEMRLQDTEGWTCERAHPVLQRAYEWMAEHADELRPLEPKNGWGDYEGALTYMENVAELCRVYRAVPGAHLAWYC